MKMRPMAKQTFIAAVMLCPLCYLLPPRSALLAQLLPLRAHAQPFSKECRPVGLR